VLFAPTRTDRHRSDWDIPLLSGCTGRELRRIDRLATSVTVDAGRMLFRRGEIGRQCFVILEGEAAVHTVDGPVFVGRGAVLGELALLAPNGRNTATVTSVTQMEVLVFTRTEFRQLMASLPTVAHRILREAARRTIASGAAG
jgi:CRP/FNR family transcriptional regulator, cyclic AMP receptor protein